MIAYLLGMRARVLVRSKPVKMPVPPFLFFGIPICFIHINHIYIKYKISMVEFRSRATRIHIGQRESCNRSHDMDVHSRTSTRILCTCSLFFLLLQHAECSRKVLDESRHRVFFHQFRHNFITSDIVTITFYFFSFHNQKKKENITIISKYQFNNQ